MVSYYHHVAVVRGWWSAIIISYYHHVAVVRGWRSAIIIMLLWSGVGGQLLSSSYCGQELVVNCAHVL